MAFAIAVVSSVTTATIMKSNSSSTSSSKLSKHKNKVEITSLMPEINKACLSEDSWIQGIYREDTVYSNPPTVNKQYLDDKVEVFIYVYDGAIAVDFRAKDNLEMSEEENIGTRYRLKQREEKGIEINSNYSESYSLNTDLSRKHGNSKFNDSFLTEVDPSQLSR